MIKNLKNKTYRFLKWSERWTKTDMVYLAKGNIWLSIFKIVASASSFILTIAFANLVLPSVYGTYKYVLSVAALFGIFSLPGLSRAYMQAVSRGNEGGFIRFLKSKIRWATLGMVGSLAMSVYYYIKEDSTLAIVFLIMGVFMPFMDNFTFYLALWNGRKEFKTSTIYRVATQIVAVVVLLITIFFTNNIIYIMLAYFAPWTFMRLIMTIITYRKHRPNEIEEAGTAKYGKHLTLMEILGTISGNLDKFLIWHFIGAGQLAIYSFAIAPTKQIQSFIKNLDMLAIPKISQRPMAELKKTLTKKILKLSIIILACTLLYIVIAPYFYMIFFPQYINATRYSQVFALTMLFYPWSFFNIALTSHTKTKELYLINTISNLVQIGAYLVLLPLYGLWGLFIALFISKAFRMSYQAFLFYRTK